MSFNYQDRPKCFLKACKPLPSVQQIVLLMFFEYLCMVGTVPSAGI